MLTLALETAQALASVALVEDGRIVAERNLSRPLAHGRELVPAIAELLAGRDPAALDLVAAATGPGSYTGLRVGLACARTIAHALGRPGVGVPLFAAIAAGLAPGPETAAALLVARRDRLYVGRFRLENGRYRPAGPELQLSPAAVLELSPRPGAVFGDGAERHRPLFAAAGLAFLDPAAQHPGAGQVGLLAASMASAGRADPLTPRYLGSPAPRESPPPGVDR